MSAQQRIKAVTTDGVGSRAGGGGPVVVTGMRAAPGSPKAAEGRAVDLVFVDTNDLRSFVRSLQRLSGDPLHAALREIGDIVGAWSVDEITDTDEILNRIHSIARKAAPLT